MKRKVYCLVGMAFLLSITGCSTKQPPENEQAEVQETKHVMDNAEQTLIVYFTLPENDPGDMDALSSASIVKQGDDLLGNTAFVAQQIQAYTKGERFEIRSVQEYPKDHDVLVDLAAQQKDDNERPPLSSTLENIEQYDTIFIGFPNWWGDLPMPVYTFLDSYDLSGKTIVPFVTHGGSGFSQTIAQLQKEEPNAKVIEQGLNLARDDVADASQDIKAWLATLDL